MAEYSIKEIKEQRNINDSTLRYYDHIGLISPKRKENNYRFYSERDKMLLIYIQVMKFAGFSLQEIMRIVSFFEEPTSTCTQEITAFLEDKKAETIKHMKHLKMIVEVLDCFIDVKVATAEYDAKKVDELVSGVYESMVQNDAKEKNK